MQEKGSKPELSAAEEDAQVELAVMRLLVEDRGMFRFGEVADAVGGATLAVGDAINRLKRGGMIHECWGFMFASRAAVVSAELWGIG